MLSKVLNLLGEATKYLKMFVVGGTTFFVIKDFVFKMATSDDNQKASYDRKIRNTIIAGICALVGAQFVSWILGYFK